jgi:hypothetical protein
MFRAVAAPAGRLEDLETLRQLLLVGFSEDYAVPCFPDQCTSDIPRVCEQRVPRNTLPESKFRTLMNQSPLYICFRCIAVV